MIKNLQIKRNRTIYQDKNNAINALNNIKNDLKDGEIVLSRYYVNGNIETLIGIKTINGNTHNINYLDSFADLSGSEIQASTTKITSDIPVVGGPLADLVGDKIKTITAGTDVQTLLFNLFCEELYPTNYKSQKGNVTASINAPTLTLKTSSILLNNNISLEVGTKVSATTISFSGNSIANMTASTVTGMTYGYSNNDDDSKDSSDNSISKMPNTGHNESSIAKLKCTINSGFIDGEEFTLSGNDITELSVTNHDLGVIDDDTNQITVSVTGQPIHYSIDSISSVYPCSNLGNTDSNYKTNAVDSVLLTATTAPTASSTFTINGVRYGFHGKVDEETTITSDNIRNLTNISATTISTIKVENTNVNKYIVAIPKTWNREITKVFDDNSNTVITDIYILQNDSVDVNDKNGANPKPYDIYIYKPATTADKVNHTITLSVKK